MPEEMTKFSDPEVQQMLATAIGAALYIRSAVFTAGADGALVQSTMDPGIALDAGAFFAAEVARRYG